MNDFIIRAAIESDLPHILEVYNDAIINTTAVYQEEPHTLEARKQWLADKNSASYPVLVAESDGGFAGFATYGPFRMWPGYRYTVEHSVYISKFCQGKGIGKKLVLALIAQARSQNLHVMIAGIDTAGTASLAMHLSLGFIEVAHFKEVGYKFGKWLDLKFLELLL